MDCILHADCPASPDRHREIVSEVGLTYLAEGAAHVVYRISFTGASPTTHPHLVGKLFRFRKSIPSAIPCAQTVSNYQNIIAPLFSIDNLVHLELHQVPDQKALIAKLNAALEQRESDATRPAYRQGVYLAPSAEEPNTILVTDMSAYGPDERLIEFKPKWLVQSPSAPQEAKRCRTCALRKMRTDDERRTGQRHSGREHAGFCPLDLVSNNDDVLEETLRRLCLTDEHPRTYVVQFKEHIQPLLMRLRRLQAEHNNVGLSDLDEGQNQGLSLSMALRDCSVFVKMKRGELGFQEVRLADLDLKSSEGGKLERWVGIEQRLIEEGWYTGSENAESRGQSLCRALQHRDSSC